MRTFLRNSAAATVATLAMLTCGTAGATDKSNVMAIVHKWVEAFNNNDAIASAATCDPGAIVLDDFAPHVWQGGAACAAWYKDYLAFIAQQQITAPKVTLGKVRQLDVDHADAYLVVPTALAYNKAGKPVKDRGLVTMSLKNGSSGWVITGWAWTDY